MQFCALKSQPRERERTRPFEPRAGVPYSMYALQLTGLFVSCFGPVRCRTCCTKSLRVFIFFVPRRRRILLLFRIRYKILSCHKDKGEAAPYSNRLKNTLLMRLLLAFHLHTQGRPLRMTDFQLRVFLFCP